MNSIWKFLTSLRLTVVTLVFSIIVVFVGTVAQADEGLYQAQERYFKHWLIVGASMWGHHVPIILPGGYTLGVVLLVNLVAAHIKRFKWSASKIGIHLTHLGIIVLLVGQLATDMMQEESRMGFTEGESANYIEHHREHELAVMVDAGSGQDEVVSFPIELVARGGELAHPKVPFSLRVKTFQQNGDVVPHAEALEAAGTLTTALATVEGQYSSAANLVAQAERAVETEGRIFVWREALAAIGETDTRDVVAAAKRVAAQPERATQLMTELKTRFRNTMLRRFSMDRFKSGNRYAASRLSAGQQVTAETLPPASTQGAGSRSTAVPLPVAKDMDSQNFPYAVVEIAKDGRELGTWLVSTQLRAQDIDLGGGKSARLALRYERVYLPFSLKLVQATHKKYAGSDTPKDFRSRVLIDNPATREHRETEISMNNPLRYGGLAFFQYQMTKDELDARPGSSVLQVVRNPSWLAPYIGCIVVSLGMIWQFMHHLVGFIARPRPGAAAASRGATA